MPTGFENFVNAELPVRVTLINSTSGIGHLQTVGGDSRTVIFILDKVDATVAPTANEDSGDGYAVDSRWIDVTNNKAYICVDATPTAAIWIECGGGEVHVDLAHSAGGQSF